MMFGTMNIGDRIKVFLLISIVIALGLIMDIQPLCPKELNSFIT
jgi:hypothetical protein